MTGIITFSSKLPESPARPIAASLPTTWVQTWIRLSAITGLTLPGMIELPGWTAGSTSSPRPQRGPLARKRMSLAILNSATAAPRSAPLAATAASRAALRFEVVDRFAEGEAGDLGQAGDHPARKLGVGVEAGAEGGTAQGEFQQPFLGGLQPPAGLGNLAGVAGEDLAEAHRYRILQMGAADGDDVVEGRGFPAEGLLQLEQGRDQSTGGSPPRRPGAGRWG